MGIGGMDKILQRLFPIRSLEVRRTHNLLVLGETPPGHVQWRICMWLHVTKLERKLAMHGPSGASHACINVHGEAAARIHRQSSRAMLWAEEELT